jgi:integrase
MSAKPWIGVSLRRSDRIRTYTTAIARSSTSATASRIEGMPKKGDLIFSYDRRTVGANFTRVRLILGINTQEMPEAERLHFHDLRHEGVSRLFEMGWSIPRVATVSGHKNRQSLQ